MALPAPAAASLTLSLPQPAIPSTPTATVNKANAFHFFVNFTITLPFKKPIKNNEHATHAD